MSAALCGRVQVDALVQTFNIQVLRLCGLRCGLVVDGEVVHHVLATAGSIHAVNALADEVCDLVGKSGVVRHHGGVGACEEGGMPIHVLQAFACERRASGCCAQKETACHLVTCCPDGITSALETEHGVEDVQRNHGDALGGVGGTSGDERRHRTSLIDAFMHDLSIDGFAVGQHQVIIYRRVVLAVRVVDLQRGEPGVHTERASFIRNDRHEAL